MTFSSKNFVANKNASTAFVASRLIGSYTTNYNMPANYIGLAATTAGVPTYATSVSNNALQGIKFISSNNQVLPSAITSFNGTYANYVIVNNDTNNWTLTLPLGPGGGTSTWTTGAFKLFIKKTGSGTLTIQTPADTIGTRIRGINTTSNKNYILSNISAQSIQLMYTSGLLDNGSSDATSEIWHTVSDKQLNPTNSNGSILLAGSTSTYLTIANDADFRFGTGDFTIEWWQYETDSNGFPRIFSMGTYPSASIGVSIEGGTFYLWIGGTANSFGTLTNYKNVFNHFAIVRSGTTIKVFRNGTQLGTNLTSSYNFNDTTNDLRIGNESVLSTGSAFGGNIKGFHWVKGTALYSSTFTPNYNSITPHANSKLLLNVANSAGLVTDSSGLNKTVTNTGCTFSSITHPFY